MKDSYFQTSLKLNDYISFKTECDCYTHDLTVILEKFEYDNSQIQLSLYDDIYVGENIMDSWIKRMLFRIKTAWKCLTGKGISMEYGFIFKNKEHIEQFLAYLNQSYQNLKDASESPKNENQLD